MTLHQRQAADATERAQLLLEQAGKRRKRKKRRKKRLPRACSPRSSRLARQRVRVHASVFEAALLRSAWFNSGYMFWLLFLKLFGRFPLYFHVMDLVFSVPPWYPAVTCSESATLEEYKRTGISGRRLHIFLQPLASGSHLFSVCLACGTGKLVSLGDDFFYDPVKTTVTCSVLLRPRVQVHGFIWELTSGYSFRIHHFLVRQRIHVSVSPVAMWTNIPRFSTCSGTPDPEVDTGCCSHLEIWSTSTSSSYLAALPVHGGFWTNSSHFLT